MCNIINDHKTQVEWKIQLTIAIHFLSSKDTGEMHTMHAKSDNIEIMTGNEKNGFVEKFFEHLLQKYQEDLE